MISALLSNDNELDNIVDVDIKELDLYKIIAKPNGKQLLHFKNGVQDVAITLTPQQFCDLYTKVSNRIETSDYYELCNNGRAYKVKGA